MKRMIILIFLLLSIDLRSQLRLKMEARQDLNIVECEPIWVRVILRNEGDGKEVIGVKGMRFLTRLEGFYMLVNGKEYRGPWQRCNPVWEDEVFGKDYIGKGEEIKEDIDLRIMELGEGEYEIECKIEFKDGRILKSNNLKINIKKPMGEDLEAYKYAEEYMKKAYPKGYKKIELCEVATSDKILTHFPTSTYAGWVLADFRYKTSDFDKEERKKEKLDYRDLIEKFIEANPNFVLSGYLLSKAAYISLEYGETEKACILYERSLQLPWKGFFSERLKIESKKRAEDTYNKLKKDGKCK